MTPLHDAKSTATPVPDQGIVGTPAACAMMVEPILSPSAAMGAAGGPRNLIPEGVSASAVGSSGFSEAWPQPGQTASTLARSATWTMSGTLA